MNAPYVVVNSSPEFVKQGAIFWFFRFGGPIFIPNYSSSIQIGGKDIFLQQKS